MSPEIINILDMVGAVGEDTVNAVLSDFSCPLNPEIEYFLKHNAVQFAKERLAITYLALNGAKELVAYFTLTHKALEIAGGSLSNTVRKKLKKVSAYDKESDTYLTSAFLIAQFGKNDAVEENINGTELMKTTLTKSQDIQWEIGGSVVYLECEKKQKLIDFYSSEANHFIQFKERHNDSDGIDYLMMMRILNSKRL
jgi:hypothetical protein